MAKESYVVSLIVIVLILSATIALSHTHSTLYSSGLNRNGAKSDLTYYSCQEGIELTEGNKKIFEKYGVGLSPNPETADIYIPCGYSYAQKELEGLKTSPSFVYAVTGMDNIVAKNSLWHHLVHRYGRRGAAKITPMTYVLYNSADKDFFLKEGNPQDIFIAKKNIQRQEGLHLVRKGDVNSLSALNGLSDQGYVLIQRFVDNPYLIEGHKINLRVYVLYVCNGGSNKTAYKGSNKTAYKGSNKTAYMYKDGFVYYTPKPYKYSTIPNETITTGYNRDLYARLPLTHGDLRNYLGGFRSRRLFNGIKSNLAQTLDAIGLCDGPKGKSSFQLFGCDYQINWDLSVYLLEWNKGPSLSEFDARDAELKTGVQQDAFKLMGLIPEGNEGNYQQVWRSR